MKSKFTLMELVIVLSIVFLWMTVMIAANASVNDKSKITLCAENLKKIAAAAIAYANENEEYLPSTPYSDVYPNIWSAHLNPKDKMKSSAWQLKPYLGDWEVTHCPEGYANMPEAQKKADNHTSFPYTSYLAMWNACPPMAKYNWFNRKEPGKSSDPGFWLLVGDIAAVDANPKYADILSNHGAPKDPVGANWAHVDGSVRWYARAELTRKNTRYIYPTIQ